MNLPELSVKRPITVLMAIIAIAVFGFISAEKLSVELLPNLSYPTLTIQTVYPDAAPVSVEQFVTKPVEEAVGVIPGVQDMRSSSRAGFSEVVLEFGWDEKMDFVALEVREKLGLVQLPREAEIPRVLRFDPSLDPILRLAFLGDRPLDEMRRLAERWIKPRLEAVKGAASAKVRGGLDPEIKVEADEDRLSALGLTLDDLALALRAENINQPGGTLKDWGSVYLVRTLHEFDDLKELERTVIREGMNGRIRVEDVARVTRGHKDRVEVTRVGGQEAVEIAIHREGSANTIAVAEAVRAEIELLETELSDGLRLMVLSDQSRYIEEAVGQVWSAAAIGGLLAVLVLFFFLRDLGATVIIAITIPVSVVATFLPMKWAGVTVNIMSLGGLALGVGMLVDNSIVVLEAIDRRRKEGLKRKQACIRGAGEVAGAVTAATLTTVSVFLPIVFVVGVAGQLFYDLAVTVCLSLVASLLVSLTLIPALAAFDPRSAGEGMAETLFRWDLGATRAESLPWTFRLGGMALLPVGNGRHWYSRVLTILFFLPRFALLIVFLGLGGTWWLFSRAFHVAAFPFTGVLNGVRWIYPGTLRSSLRLRFLILPGVFGLLAMAVIVGVPLLGVNLVPELAQGEFAFRLHLKEGTPLESTSDLVARVEEPLVGDPLFDRVFSVVGSLPSTASGRQTLGENLAQINFVLPDSADAVAEQRAVDRVRDVVSRFASVDAEVVYPSVLSVRPPVEVKIFCEDLDSLDRASSLVADSIEAVTGVHDVGSTSEPGSPEVMVELDRERASALGVQAEMVGRSLRRQIRGEVVGQFREEEERLDIRLRASEGSRNRASEVEDLRIRLASGMTIPISSVADVEVGRGPAAIHRAGGARVSRITAKTSGGDLGLVLERIRTDLRGLELPNGAVAELGGQDEELKVSFASLRLAMALAIFLVFVVMAMQFESVVHPFVILLSVPLGAVGVIGVLLLTGTTISVLVLIGAVMLAGIVVNNAIVLVDAINRRRRSGERLRPAIVAAGQERLRPILMTTATTVLALLPLALGLGAGDELRRPMAIAVIGGLSAATLLTLFVIPCMYLVLSRDRLLSAEGDGGDDEQLGVVSGVTTRPASVGMDTVEEEVPV